jgi:hypothetical protein
MGGCSFFPSLVPVGCASFGLPFCLPCDGSNHQFLLCFFFFFFPYIFYDTFYPFSYVPRLRKGEVRRCTQ